MHSSKALETVFELSNDQDSQGSGPNSSDRLIFVKRRALFGQKYERTDRQNSSFVILSSFCGLVHAQSIVDLFAKLLNNAQNVPIITERRAKSQKYGR